MHPESDPRPARPSPRPNAALSAPEAPRPRPRRSSRLARGGLVAGALLAGACAPELPVGSRSRAAPEPEPAPKGLAISSFPAGEGQELPAVAPLIVGPGPLDPARLLLVEGEVSEAQRRNASAGRISKSLEARRVPAVALAADAIPGLAVAVAEPAALVVPSRPLEAGLRHTLLAGEGLAATFDVESEGAAPPWLERVWPLPEQAAVAGFGIFCGEEDLGELPRVPTLLDPAPPPGQGRRAGARLLPEGLEVDVFLGLGDAPTLATGCVRISPSPRGAPAPGEAPLPPPRLETSAGTFALDPRPLGAGEAGEAPADAPWASQACSPEELPLGPACARVADDRAFVRAPEADLFFAWGGKSGAARPSGWIAMPASGAFLIAGLEPASPLELDVTTLDAAGRGQGGRLEGATGEPAPHLVLSEALANPKGSEPAQEWIEIVNDGAIEASLEGFVIVDVGGETPLGGGELAPGAFALVVREDYAPDPELDPVAPEGTLVVRVPAIGKAGLSNEGELLRLRDPEGRIVSRLLPGARPKAGESLARRAPKAPDVPGSFFAGKPTPGRENGAP